MKSARFDFLTAVLLKIQVSWDVTLCCISEDLNHHEMKIMIWERNVPSVCIFSHTEEEDIRNGKCMTLGIV
jgi:hypothetical protein